MSINLEPDDNNLFGPYLDDDEKEQETEYLGYDDKDQPKPEVLSFEESMKLRMELIKAQQELMSMQKAAEKSKAPKANWDSTEEDYYKFSEAYGYNIGIMLSGKQKAEKANKTLAKIANGLGESFDENVAASGIRAAVIGYQKAQARFKFKSLALVNSAIKDASIFGPIAYAEINDALAESITTILFGENKNNPWE